MIRIAIIDDEIKFSNQMMEITRQYFEPREIEYEAVIYRLPQELIWDIDEGQYFDIYLIDIEMPAVNGMELAHAIRQKYDEPFIIFVTSHLEYSIRGYEYNAWRYIIKNKMWETLPHAFDCLQVKMAEKMQKLYVIEMHSKVSKVAYNDIYFLHKDGKYTNFHIKQGMLRERKPIGKVYEELNDKIFQFADRAYVVNLRHVMMFGNHVLTMRDGTEIPVSIPQFQKMKRVISDYWRGDL